MAEPTDTTQNLKSHCPMCDQREMIKHCANRLCSWAKCNNKKCDALLDLRRNIGTCRFDGSPLINLVRPNTKWVVRPLEPR